MMLSSTGGAHLQSLTSTPPNPPPDGQSVYKVWTTFDPNLAPKVLEIFLAYGPG